MKMFAIPVAVGLLLSIGVATAEAQNQNNNQGNNGEGRLAPLPPPRISRSARIRNPLLQASPFVFMAACDVGDGTVGSARDGQVSFGEFLSGLSRRNGNNLNQVQVNNLFNSMDHDFDGFITLMDFGVFVPPIGPVGT